MAWPAGEGSGSALLRNPRQESPGPTSQTLASAIPGRAIRTKDNSLIQASTPWEQRGQGSGSGSNSPKETLTVA